MNNTTIHNIEFEIGQVVFLKTDTEQHPRIVTGIYLRPNDVLYNLAYGSTDSVHFGIEIDEEKDLLKKMIA